MATSIRTYGDKDKAAGHWQAGEFFLNQLRHAMGFQSLKQGFVARTMPDGTEIVAKSTMGTDWVDIIAPVGGSKQKTTTRKASEDLFVAFNVPERNAAWDIDAQEKMSTYLKGIPTETWGLETFSILTDWYTESSLEGDPVVYMNHDPVNDPPHDDLIDSRFNILKSWTYNLATQSSSSDLGWMGRKSITIFHRKSFNFADVIRGNLHPYINSGDTIDVFQGDQGSGITKQIISVAPLVAGNGEWGEAGTITFGGARNFYVAPDGEITILALELIYDYNITKFYHALVVRKYDIEGVVLSTDTYKSATWTTDNISKWWLAPMTVAYDGSDFYCGTGQSFTFSEAFIYQSAAMLYDYDPVLRSVVSIEKHGYLSTDTYPDLWWIAQASWYDFVASAWHVIDVEYTDLGGGSGQWEFFDNGVSLWVESGTSPYTTFPYTYLDPVYPVWWCYYGGAAYDWDEQKRFPMPPNSWNLHYSLGGYQRICTQDAYDNNRPAFDQWAGFSQVSGTWPDLSTGNDVLYRKFDGSVRTSSRIAGEEAKWTTNGVILKVEKVTTTTTTVTEGVANG